MLAPSASQVFQSVVCLVAIAACHADTHPIVFSGAVPAPTLSPPTARPTSPIPASPAARVPIPASPLASADTTPSGVLTGSVRFQGQVAPGVRLRVLGSGGFVKPLQSDDQGQVTLADVPPGQYQLLFYNDTNRAMLGFWRSQTLRVDKGQSAIFKAIELALVGFQNTPAPNATVRGRTRFTWTRPPYPLQAVHWRLHSRGGTRFELLARSPELPGDTTAWEWVLPDSLRGRRCYWGVQWRDRNGGTGGNLFQPVTLAPETPTP